MAASFPELEARVKTLLLPIEGPKPSGEDVTFDPEFERVKAEVDKLGSVSAGLPDWASVAELSGKLLSTRSKDMRLASWLLLAKMNLAGWSGLAEGLVVLRELTTNHWDTMYPERRPRARANLYGWLVDHVATTLDPKPVSAADADVIRASRALFQEIDAQLSEKLGDLHPGMALVRRLLESRIAGLPATTAVPPAAQAAAPPGPVLAPATAPAPAAGVAAAPATSAAPVALAPTFNAAAPPAITSAESVVAALNVCRNTALQAAQLLWAQDKTMAWAYHLRRVGAWMAVRAIPGTLSPDNPKTTIPAPPPAVRGGVDAAFANGRWLAVLNEGEPLAGLYIYWFDLQRMISVALEKLGTDYAAANLVVRDQVRGFVARYPTVPRLAYSDGTPLASSETQTWLDSLGSSSTGGGGGAAAALEEEAAAEMEAAVLAARAAFDGGRVGEGVGLLLAASRRAERGEEKFEKLLLAARMAVEGKKSKLARPLLDELLQRIDSHALEIWQPELCIAVYTTVLESLRASAPVAGKQPSPPETESAILEKICRLDPALAVRLGM